MLSVVFVRSDLIKKYLAEQWRLHTVTHRNHTRTCVCVPGLPSLRCSDDWVSLLDWNHSCSAIPLSTVRNHLVSLGLLQSNWPFKEGLHHVKQWNWERYSCFSIPHFVIHSSILTFLTFCGFAPSSSSPFVPGQLLSACCYRSASCSCRVTSSADYGWPLSAPCHAYLCYHFSTPGLSRAAPLEPWGSDFSGNIVSLLVIG